VAWIQLENLGDQDVASCFERLLGELGTTPGLVLDLRDNSGGLLDVTMQVISRLITEPLMLGEDCAWSEHFDHEDPRTCRDLVVEPDPSTYAAPVAVLINEATFSGGEYVAYALCRSGRARCFGRTTAGETDSVTHHEIPGALVAVSSGRFHPALGSELFGGGVVPDVHVEWTIRDLTEGRDPDLEAAHEWLLEIESTEPI
jgi:tricorn protease